MDCFLRALVPNVRVQVELRGPAHFQEVVVYACSVLGVWELYLITRLASDGDWAPNDQMGDTGWVLGEYPNDLV